MGFAQPLLHHAQPGQFLCKFYWLALKPGSCSMRCVIPRSRWKTRKVNFFQISMTSSSCSLPELVKRVGRCFSDEPKMAPPASCQIWRRYGLCNQGTGAAKPASLPFDVLNPAAVYAPLITAAKLNSTAITTFRMTNHRTADHVTEFRIADSC